MDERPAAAMYLAGYAVECILKAMILSHIPVTRHRDVLAEEFRGSRAHDIGWLRTRLRQTNAAPFPSAILDDLTFVSTWSTELRYTPGLGDPEDSSAFVNAVHRVVEFAKGRLS